MANALGTSLTLKNVTFYYSPGEVVLDRLSFEIKSGEFVTVLGPSGCGKSTLLRILAGLEKPKGGSIQLDSRNDPINKGIVFQESRLLPWRTVLSNVRLPLELKKVSPETSLKNARDSLVRVGLGDAESKYPNQLSGGMKMRAAVARALVSRPSLLLFDEPFASLDEYSRHSLQNDLRDLWSKLKMTVFFITHSISEATFLSDRVIVLSQRPAGILSDTQIQLPLERNPSTRLKSEFSAEMQKLSRFLSPKEWT